MKKNKRAFYLFCCAFLLASGVAMGNTLAPEFRNDWVTNSPSGWWTNQLTGLSLFGGQIMGNTNATAPTDGHYQLVESSFSQPSGGDAAQYAIGETFIAPPGIVLKDQPLIEPTNQIIAIWSPFDGKVYAAGSGTARVTWNLTNGTQRVMTYSVSGAAAKPVVSIFWTEQEAGKTYGPPVMFSDTYNQYVIYNQQIRNTNDVWVDQLNNLHAARHVTGRFLLVYTQVLNQNGTNTEVQKGWEIVDVKEPVINIAETHIGKQLHPISHRNETAGISVRVRRGIPSDTTSTTEKQYIYMHKGGKMDGNLYALRENEFPWEVEVYWLRKSDMGVSWPFEVVDYSITWPNASQFNLLGYATNTGPGIEIPAVLSTKLWDYQIPPGHAELDGTLFRANEAGQCLLQYTDSDMNTWFDVIQSVWHDDPRVYAQKAIDWPIGSELQPKDIWYTLNFDGSNSFMVATNGFGTNMMAATIEMWVKPDIEQTGNLFYVAESSTSTNINALLRSHVSGARDGSFSFSLNDGSIKWMQLDPAHRIEQDTWYHLAVTISAENEMRLFVNGQEAGSCGIATPVFAGRMMFVGAAGGGVSQTYRGEIADLRLWNRVLSETEIYNGMETPLTGSESGLLAWYPVFIDSGNQVYDCTEIPADNNPKNAWLVGNVSRDIQVMEQAFDGTPMSDLSLVPGYRWTGEAYNTNLYHELLSENGAFSSTELTNHTSYLYGVNTNQMEIWWFQKGQTGMPETIYWPAFPVKYNLVWPQTSDTIVVASGLGNGGNPSHWNEVSVYAQNNDQLPGYNPNEEHALLLGDTIYALRDDLNTPNSSEPYVLAQFTDTQQERPDMHLFHVLATNDTYTFSYTNAVAGKIVQLPNPLSQMPISPYNSVYAGTAIKDRNGSFWAYRGGIDGGFTTLQYRNFYQTRPTFWFPRLDEQPAVGTDVPWLSQGTGLTGTPVTITCQVRWPDDAPKMKIADSLITAKNGLPAIKGQKSVGILYQQSKPISQVVTNIRTITRRIVEGHWVKDSNGEWGMDYQTNYYPITQETLTDIQPDEKASVVLMDPTQARGAWLSEPPDQLGIRTKLNPADGLIYFSDLPPDLASRIYYDPTSQQNNLMIKGEYKQPIGADAYLLLNRLTTQNRTALLALSDKPTWQQAVEQMPTNILQITHEDTPFDSLALSSSVGSGIGFVTLMFNNSTNLCDPGDPISLALIQVVPELYNGQLNLNYPANPLNEKTSLKYSADLAGQLEEYEFQWRYQSQAGGGSPDLPMDEADPQWLPLDETSPSYTIEGPGLKTIQDLYFTCRYHALNPTNPVGTNIWSAWTTPKLHESWIKRVLKAINPFDQRISDWYSNEPYSLVSMIGQAGTRSEGDIALNQEELNNYGLISIYETVLQRGMDMTINGIPPQADENANNALMMAAGRICDLYMLLGNEAYADACDPTIAYSTDNQNALFAEAASSIFSFMNQVPTLLDESLALLRGRNGSGNVQPPVTQAPVYNRMPWNFTADIMGGQVAYALNYDIRSQTNSADAFTVEVASELYPQGHGDAYGHYLTSIKGYYALLHHPSFKWWPMSEAINLGVDSSITVDVSYMHERRMAQTALARARTAVDVVKNTWRHAYQSSSSDNWKSVREKNITDAWDPAGWATRGTQGAFFDWVMVNAMLPESDPSQKGISRIDRHTVPELQQLPLQAKKIQQAIDAANLGLNPLGIAEEAIPFDISAQGIDQGKTHFEQMYDRSLTTLRNANAAFEHASKYTLALRRQNDSQQDFLVTRESAEQAYKNRLIELFGYPYADDIGPGKTYAQGYNGPDFFHASYIDVSDISGQYDPATNILTLAVSSTTLEEASSAGPGELLNNLWAGVATPSSAAPSFSVQLTLNNNGFLAKPENWTGQRRAEGEIQQAARDIVRAYYRLQEAYAQYDHHQDRITDLITLWNTSQVKGAAQLERLIADNKTQIISSQNIRNAELASAALLTASAVTGDIAGDIFLQSIQIAAINPVFPIFGLIAAPMGIAGWVLSAASAATGLGGLALQIPVANMNIDKEMTGYATQEYMAANALPSDIPLELTQALRQQETQLLSIQQAAVNAQDALERYRTTYTEAQRTWTDLSTMRSKTAADLKNYRYKDMAFRIFRNDALEKYQSAFDMAARYAFLAAKAYDYETGLLNASDGTTPASVFMDQIVKATSLGAIDTHGTPLTGNSASGDPGLADALAKMNGDWSVLKGRLGFNNPQSETGRFSLRSELFRISPLASSDERWQQTLRRCVVDNIFDLPVFRQYALPFSPHQPKEPGIVIPFSTEILFGNNVFGHTLAARDNAYDSTHFATKIRSVGIWFDNYAGPAGTNGASLANQPRVYLIPAGADVIRAPSEDGEKLRSWTVLDQSIPLPYNISGSDLDAPDWNATQGSLLETFAKTRRIPSLRAYHAAETFDDTEFCANSRLIGRSVWNTQWYLIIPAGTLMDDRNEALNRFIYGPLKNENETGAPSTRNADLSIKDIKIMFKTYSYFGE